MILVVVGGFWATTKTRPLNEFDQGFYLGIAHDLRHQGRFTDGYIFGATAPDGTRASAMRFAPVYPALLAVAGFLDPAFGRAMDCVVRTSGQDDPCPNDAGLLRIAQVAMLAGFYLLVWSMAGRLSRSPRVAWLALLLALPTVPLLLRYANYAMTEVTALVLFTSASAMALAIFTGRRPLRAAALAGLLLALASLTRPAFAYLTFAALATACVVMAVRWRCPPVRYRAGLFILATALPLAAWILRNALVVGHVGLTHGYDSHTLVQRLAFDLMNWSDYGRSYLCWLPDGKGLGDRLFGRGACDRFYWGEQPDVFYAIGNGPLMQSTLAAAGGWDGHLGYLIRAYLLADPVKYAAVTLSLAVRGAWVNHVWGLLLMPVCLAALIRAALRRDWPLLAVLLPAWFLLGFNAAVAVNQVRYNLILIPAYAIAGALLLEGLLARWLPPALPPTRNVEAPSV